ncbi:hypothetical protein [Bacillus sp. GBSW19]|uniref:hypothetical protein n=1 Tax=Bacillus sp. GBSW19 TaxID=2108545 RepID=UPI0016703BDB|nr:hypothetical protein [Bacillus sp. GBSW19]
MRSNGLTVGGFGQSPKRVTGEPVPTYAPEKLHVYFLSVQSRMPGIVPLEN